MTLNLQNNRWETGQKVQACGSIARNWTNNDKKKKLKISRRNWEAKTGKSKPPKKSTRSNKKKSVFRDLCLTFQTEACIVCTVIITIWRQRIASCMCKAQKKERNSLNFLKLGSWWRRWCFTSFLRLCLRWQGRHTAYLASYRYDPGKDHQSARSVLISAANNTSSLSAVTFPSFLCSIKARLRIILVLGRACWRARGERKSWKWAGHVALNNHSSIAICDSSLNEQPFPSSAWSPIQTD